VIGLKRLIVTTAFLIAKQICYAQDGDYFITNYDKRTYNGASQNFDVIQDDFGQMYFANNACILTYDGKTWDNVFVTSEGKTPFCMAKAPDGRIYVGGENEIGYLDRDVNGKVDYRSLIPFLSEAQCDFSRIWYIVLNGTDVYYCGNEVIIRFRNGKVKTWKPKLSFHKLHLVGGHIFVREVGRGLLVLNSDDEFVEVEDGEILSSPDSKIASIVESFLPSEYFIFTRSRGIFKFKLDTVSVVKSKVSKEHTPELAELLDHEIFDVLLTQNSQYLIATKDAGIFLYSKDLKYLQNITSQNGLLNKSCNKVFCDRQNNIWIALDNGISKIEINSPITKWDKTNNIESPVETFAEYKGLKYIGTLEGVMKYSPITRKFEYLASFKKNRCSDLKVIDGYLYVATDNGLYCYDGFTIQQICIGSNFYRIYTTTSAPDKMFCLTNNSIIAINKKTRRIEWQIDSPLYSEVKSLGFLSAHELLASTRSEGMFYCNAVTHETKVVSANKCYSPSSENSLLNYKGKTVIGSDSGVYYVDRKLQFKDFLGINRYLKNKYAVSKVGMVNSILFLSASVIGGRDDGKEENFAIDINHINERSFSSNILNRIGETTVREFIPFNNVVYMPTDDGVFIYDCTRKLVSTTPRPLISKVIGKNDTLMFSVKSNDTIADIPYIQNSLKFVLGSNDFSLESKLCFQYYLEGRDSGYSSWVGFNEVNYDNLNEGIYVFHVRVKNIYGQVSDELLLQIEILPPWYRTILAYVIYLVAAIALFGILTFLNSKRLIAKNKKLEQIVYERTNEITHQKKEIEIKNKEITDSINYAKKIQLALMASKKLLDKHLISSLDKEFVVPRDYFILYRPKDIVSGDFYWAAEVKQGNQKDLVVVVADCTGHGVPGAFMSLLCIGFLNEIVKEKHIYAPHEIFNNLRDRIISTLNPEGSETEQKDGMDAVIFRIRPATNKLEYAAANNSLYVVRDKEIKTLNSDKMPIGKHISATYDSFTENFFELKPGDRIYAFTDGYADQFGGPKGKKYKYKKLEENLLAASSLGMSAQKDTLNSNLELWKGDLEQVDDILALGIKF